ncbi:MAG: threonine synthase [Chthonomonadales bacterium]|nr:threonine synthase [Chthonomonadales bacterium]
MMSKLYRCWFECTNPACRATYPLNEPIYQCRLCGGKDKRSGLLTVRHDMDALKQRTAKEWMSLFDERYLRTAWPYGSGVWGKKEWVCPVVDNENIVSCLEGGSNLFWAKRFGQELGLDDFWVKLCGNSHTGSFKDLGMTVLVSMVHQMRSEGVPIRAVACASTGDTSAALAAYCAAANIPSIVLLPENKITVPQLIQPLANGATTFALDTDFDGCMAVVAELCKDKGIYLANSMNSLRLEGQKTIAMEIVQQFEWQPIDWVVIPVGNCGNISAIGQGFLMLKELGIIDRLPRIVGAQAENANPLAQLFREGYPDRPFVPMTPRETQANAIRIGDPISLYKAIDTLKQMPGHFVLDVTEDELADACARADRTGLFACPHTGVALAAMMKLVDQGEIHRSDRVVVISTANGLKFPDFKIAYHSGQAPPGVTARLSNMPIKVPASVDAVRDALDARLNAVGL